MLSCVMSLTKSLPTKAPSERTIAGGSELSSLQAEYVPASLPYWLTSLHLPTELCQP
jgi:hypothetical protein